MSPLLYTNMSHNTFDSMMMTNMSQIKIDNKRSSLISSGLVEIERKNTPNNL